MVKLRRICVNRILPIALSIIFIMMIAVSFGVFSPKNARAFVVADDIIIGGTIIAWLSAAGLAIDAALADGDGTTESIIAGLKALTEQADADLNYVNGYIWGQLLGAINDISIFVDETVIKPFIKIDNAATGVVNSILNEFSSWLITDFQIVSEMAVAEQLYSNQSVFLVDGSTVTLGYDTNATKFYMDTTYNFIKGNSIAVSHQAGTKNYTISINNGAYVNTQTGSVNSDATFYTLGTNTALDTLYVNMYVYRTDGITRNGTFTISRSTDNNSSLFNGFADEFLNPASSTLDGLGKDVLPDLDQTDYTTDDNIFIGSQSGALDIPTNPDIEDLTAAWIEAASDGTLTSNPSNVGTRQVTDTAPDPGNDDDDDKVIPAWLPGLPINIDSSKLNNLINAMSSIWDYVVDWVQSLGSWFTFMFGVFSNLPYAMVVPIYASVVIVVIVGMYKRFFM